MDGMQQPKTHLSLRVLPTSHAILINLSTRLSEWSHLKSSPMLRTMNHDLPCRICGLCFLLKRVRCFRWAFSASGWDVCVTSSPCRAGSKVIGPSPFSLDWLGVLSGFRAASPPRGNHKLSRCTADGGLTPPTPCPPPRRKEAEDYC